jgi:predicted nucleotidyltransferase
MDTDNNPRKWSSKFWKKNNVSEIIKEIIEPDAVDVSSIQMNDELNPLIWNEEGTLKPDVRKTLLKNAKRFIEFSDVENLKFDDVILTGSMANYNYGDNSDLDIHIVMDFNQISENKDFVGDYLKLKKQLWAEKLPVQVKGHDVEMYFQDSAEPHHSTGTYSLVKNDWIRKPIKKIINIDIADVQLKSADLINYIDELEKEKDSESFIEKHKKLFDKIKKYRQSGLDKSGEYSVENLAFKILRNNGYLKKLTDMKNEYLTQELGLNEILNSEL